MVQTFARSADSRGKSPGQLRRDLLLTLPFLLFFYLQLAHHQLWRDELNAFGIAAGSADIRTLLSNVHYEGHPYLWYVLLWLVSRFTSSQVGMKVLEGLIGTAIYLVLGIGSPFSRLEKLLLFLCYFVSFEYTVLSRMYGVLLLLALLYFRLRARHPRPVLGGAVLLGLMAGTDVTGLLLSVALVLELAANRWFARSRTRNHVPAQPDEEPGTAKLVGAAFLYLALVAISVLSVVPAPDISIRNGGHMFAMAGSKRHLVAAVLNYVVVPYLPTVTGLPHTFWDAKAPEGHLLLFAMCAPLILGAYWISLRRHGHLLVLLGGTLLMGVGFSHLVYMGSARHFGVVFVAFLGCLWILRSRGQPLSWAAYLLLAATAVAGVQAAAESWTMPFSNAGTTAAWLRVHEPGIPLVGSPDTTTIAVAELLHRPIYMLDCNCTESFLRFSNVRDAFQMDQIPDRLVVALRNLGVKQVVFIDSDPLTQKQELEIRAMGLAILPMAQFTGAAAWGEDFYLYAISGP